MAAGDLRQERNEKNQKKEGSPQGLEEGKNEGIMFPRRRGISLFSKNSQSIFCLTSYTDVVHNVMLLCTHLIMSGQKRTSRKCHLDFETKIPQ